MLSFQCHTDTEAKAKCIIFDPKEPQKRMHVEMTLVHQSPRKHVWQKPANKYQLTANFDNVDVEKQPEFRCFLANQVIPNLKITQTSSKSILK